MIASARPEYADAVYEFLGCSDLGSECAWLDTPGSIINEFSLYLIGESLERIRE